MPAYIIIGLLTQPYKMNGNIDYFQTNGCNICYIYTHIKSNLPTLDCNECFVYMSYDTHYWSNMI